MGPVIQIIGAAGAGKTTLARGVAEQLGLDHADTDDVQWLPTDLPFSEKREVPERLAMLRDRIERSRGLVLSGSLSGWGDQLVPLLAGVVRLDTPTDVRLARLRQRERERYGTAIDAGGPRHAENEAFLAWAQAYDGGIVEGRNRARDDTWLSNLSCPALDIDGTAPLNEQIAVVLRWIKES